MTCEFASAKQVESPTKQADSSAKQTDSRCHFVYTLINNDDRTKLLTPVDPEGRKVESGIQRNRKECNEQNTRQMIDRKIEPVRIFHRYTFTGEV